MSVNQFGNAWPSPSKIIVSIWRKLSCLPAHKNSNWSLFSLSFLSMILQKNSKYNILGKLGMPGHTSPKWWYQFQEIFNVYLQAKYRLCPSSFPWDIANKLQTCYFWYFGHTCLRTSKLMLSASRNLSCLSTSKKSTSSPTFFERYCKDMQTSSFGYFGHAWLRTSKVIV